jgi:hypothetical protein
VTLPEGCTAFGETLVSPGGKFRWHEFAMKPKPEDRATFGTYTDVPEDRRDGIVELVSKCLQPLRERMGPLRVTGRGGYRSPEFNRHSGGAPHSQHVLGRAADIYSALGSRRIHDALLRLRPSGVVQFGAVGIYSTFVHVDIRPRPHGAPPVRWDLRDNVD